MTGFARFVNPRIPPTTRRNLISLMMLILTESQAPGFLKQIPTPDRVNNRIPLAIAAPISSVSYARKQGTLEAGICITTVINEMHLIISIPRRTWTDV